MGLFGGEDKEEKSQDQSTPGDERREQIQDILNDYSIDQFSDPEKQDFGRVSSREYKAYRQTEEKRQQKNWYVKLVDTLGFYEIDMGETRKKIEDAKRLLLWDLDVSKIFSAALVVSALSLMLVLGLFIINFAFGLEIPTVFLVGSLMIPLIMLYYIVQYPILRVQQKVIKASDELILAMLYMVIYMRNSPNIEGAVRFAALNTDGAISEDLKHVLWETEVGNYTTVEEALSTYARKWRTYNKDFIQSIELLVEATAEADNERRENILAESINNLLEGTRDKMKKYARELRMPVSATFALGILLPVLGMIMFPLVASFMGGGGLEIYLSFTYNILIPIMLYIVVYYTLMRRPPSIATQNVESDMLPEKGIYRVSIGERQIGIPAILFSIVAFLILGAWPLMYYYNVLTGNAPLPPDIASGTDITVITMFRSLMLTIAASVSLGLYFYLGNVQRIEELNKIGEMESEFPEALFQLGNALGRGNPIETSIWKAINNMQQLDISEMFRIIAYNMNEIGLTFEQAIFDKEYGALRRYPSRMIRSVMRAINKSSQKGTHIVSKAMMSISKYLKNIYQTEEEIQEQLSETLATMSFLAFILAPVISGVALGLGTIITKAFFQLQRFEDTLDVSNDSASSELTSGPTSELSGGGSGLGGAFDLQNAVPPDILQLVIGLYLIELGFIIGMFYVRLTEGENPIVQKMFTGKVLIVTPILYAITTLLLVLLFGNMISGQMVQGLAAG